MDAKILPADPQPHPLPDPGGWDKMSKSIFFQNIVMLHIKLKGLTHAAT